MRKEEQNIIKLVVKDENTLYSPFSPEAEFTDAVRGYLWSRLVDETKARKMHLKVISDKPFDEDRFRAATTNWISSEKASFKIKESQKIRLLIGVLLFGSVMIILSIMLQERYEVLRYSLLPVLGSISLAKAAGIIIEDLPTVSARKWIVSEMEKQSSISFEYTDIHE